MLQLANSTPFAAMPMLFPDAAGVDTLFTVVKGTFVVGRHLAVADVQVPVTMADAHYGDPAASSIRVPSDVSLEKPGTDVLLTGSAWAPGGRAAWQVDVSLTVGPATKTVRVFGDRVWDTGPGGAVAKWVAPFERVPLVWERAFGGHDETDKGPAADPRNPVGVGFRAPGGAKALRGSPLPNVEDPAALISSPRDTPAPAGFAPVAAHWQPRVRYAGTYDAAWLADRAPYLPDDFDARFCHVAPTGLSTRGHLQGGEWVDLRGATPDGALQFQLPALRVAVQYTLDQGPQTRPAALDTVIVDSDAQRVVLVWRAALRCDKKVLKVKEVRPSVVQAS